MEGCREKRGPPDEQTKKETPCLPPHDGRKSYRCMKTAFFSFLVF